MQAAKCQLHNFDHVAAARQLQRVQHLFECLFCATILVQCVEEALQDCYNESMFDRLAIEKSQQHSSADGGFPALQSHLQESAYRWPADWDAALLQATVLQPAGCSNRPSAQDKLLLLATAGNLQAAYAAAYSNTYTTACLCTYAAVATTYKLLHAAPH
jgi:hypothetical protein